MSADSSQIKNLDIHKSRLASSNMKYPSTEFTAGTDVRQVPISCLTPDACRGDTRAAGGEREEGGGEGLYSASEPN